MKKHIGVIASFLVAGCAAVRPVSLSGTLILRPQVLRGTVTQGAILPYSKASIENLTLTLYSLQGEVATPLGIQKTIPNAQLDNPVALSNLRPQTKYRIKASAYAVGGGLISTNDASSSTDVELTDNDRPVIATIKVQLIDKAFSAQASSSLSVNPGTYVPAGSESLRYAGLQGVVDVFAGMGVATFSEGVGTLAGFNTPHSLEMDSQGNLYVADFKNHRIRVISPSGVVTTLAGNGSAACVDGTGTLASINNPTDVAIDAQGNVFVAEYGSSVIRKITPQGVVSVFAGNGATGFADGTGTLAALNRPTGIIMDAQGNFFVADLWNHAIRKITPSGVVSTYAGCGTGGFLDGTAEQARFSKPENLALDPQGNLYVADRDNHRIRKISPDRVVSTFVGSGLVGHLDGIGSNVVMNTPVGIVIDARGYLLVAERYGHCIREIAPNGKATTVAGNMQAAFADGTGFSASFSQPYGLCLDPQGNLYVGENTNHLIRRVR